MLEIAFYSAANAEQKVKNYLLSSCMCWIECISGGSNVTQLWVWIGLKPQSVLPRESVLQILVLKSLGHQCSQYYNSDINFNCKFISDRKVIVLHNCDSTGVLIDLKTSAKNLKFKPFSSVSRAAFLTTQQFLFIN